MAEITDPNALAELNATGPDALAQIRAVDPGRANQIEAMTDGREGLPSGMSMRSPYAQQLLADANRVDPTLDATSLPGRVAARKAFTSGKQGQNITSFNTALAHLGVLAQNADDLGNFGSIPLVNTTANTIKNAAESGSGQPAPNNFDVAKNAVIDELTRAFRGSGGNVHDIESWESTINSSQSPAQLRGAIKQAAALLQGRVDAMQDSYNSAMQSTDHPLPMLNPNATAALAKFQSPDYLAKGYGVVAPLVPADNPPPSAGGQGSDGGQNGPGPAPSSQGGVPPVAPAGGGLPARQSGGSVPPLPSAPSSGGATIDATARNEVTPQQQHIANALEAGINSGQFKTAQDALAFAGQNGWDPNDQKFAASLQAAYDYKAKGGKGYIDVATPVAMPTGKADAAGAAAIGLADSASFGTLNKLGSLGDTAVAKIKGDNRSFGDIYNDALAHNNATLDQAQTDHPIATLAGNIGGFMVGDAALGAVAKGSGALGYIPAALRPATGDALYGAAYGAGSSDHLGDVPGNAIGGASLAALGGAAGRGLVKGAAALSSPLASGAAQRLTDAGITLTPGQMAGATGTKIGGWIKGAEDKATSIPIVGDAINSARRGGVEDFNRATGNKVLSSIDQELPSDVPAGHAMIQHLQNAVGDAYDKALTPLRANADQQLGNDFSTIQSAVRPDQQDAFKKVMQDVVQPHLPQGNDPMTGTQLQMIKRGLNEKISQFKGDANGADLAGDLEDLRDSFMQFAERSDPKSAAAYRAADAANAKLKRVETAAAGTKDGVFSPQQFRSAVGRRGYGTTTANLAANTAPMQDLATDASTILPSTTPDSGSGGRLLFNQAVRHALPAALGGGLGAADDGKKGAVIGAALGAGLYSKPGLAITQKVLMGARGKTATTLGDLLRDNAALGGAGGTPLLLRERGYRDR